MPDPAGPAGDHEWSCAVGIGEQEDPAKTPGDKSAKINDAFPWGATWPPPPGAGNYSGEETIGHVSKENVLAGYRDDFLHTAPVGRYAANRFGIFDLGGNAWEWCEDPWTPTSKSRVLRGAGADMGDRLGLLSSARNGHLPDFRYPVYGLGVVLAESPAAR